MATENRRNIDWLIEKLREAERERDEVIEHAKNLEVDNFRLRFKLQAVGDIAGSEEYIGTLDIPDDNFADIPDDEENSGMTSI